MIEPITSRQSPVTNRSVWTGLLRLARPFNCLIVFGSVLIGAVIAGAVRPVLAALVAAVSAALIAGGANGLNDFFDTEVDLINKPWRPIPSGQITKKAALIGSVLLLALGISFGGMIGKEMLLVALGAVVLLVFYNFKLKQTAFWGNLTVSSLCGLAFVYGGMSVERPEASLIPAGFALFFHLGREIIKDAEDSDGDASAGADTIPIRYGVKTALGTTTAIYTMLILLTSLPFLAGIYGLLYLLVVAIGVDIVLCYVIWSMWRDSSSRNLGKLSRILKFDMLVGLLAIFVGRLP